MVKIRRATIADLPQLQELFTQTIENTCKPDYTAEQIKAWQSSTNNSARWIAALKDQYFLLAETDALVVGFGSLKKGGHIDFLYVHQDHLRKGIASNIYLHLALEAERLGKTVISADVSKTARPFFEQLGFTVEQENSNNLGGVALISYRMIKMCQPQGVWRMD